MAEKLKFYNILAHINYKNRLLEETVAVKKVWLKDNSTFFDLYFYRNHKSYVIEKAFIHDMVDLTSEVYYDTADKFIKDYFSDREIDLHPSLTAKPQIIEAKVFEAIETDLVILTFLANCAGDFSEIKERALEDYILMHQPPSSNLSSQYMRSYISQIKPSPDNYYEALVKLSAKTPTQATGIVKGAFKVCLSDGQLHYQEKLYIAEMLQILREQGLEPDIDL